MGRKFYLAYGSNLNVEQMKQRCPGAVMIGMACLEDYRITFRGNSRSGVANIEPRKGIQADIRTKQSNAFDGEPSDPVPEGTVIEFVPERDTWPF